MAVIITQVVQLSNLPAANQGILILNLNSVFSLSLSLLRGKIITKHIDRKQRRSNYLKFSWRSKTLFSELKVFSFLFCFSRNCCWPIPILYSVLIVIVPGKIRTGNLLWKTVYNANFSLTNWSQGDRYLNIETLGLFIYLCSLSTIPFNVVHLLHTLNRQYKQFSRGEMAHCHHFIGLTRLFLGLISHLRLWTAHYHLWLFP